MITTAETKWKTIDEFDNYEVCNLGFVRNRNSRKIKKQCTHENGYFYVQLWKNGKKYNKSVHRLVAKAFIENPNNLKEVDHVDGNKSNNQSENLRWATRSQNIANTNMPANNKSGIKGVSWDKKAKKYHAQIRINNKQYHLEYYVLGRSITIYGNICR